MVYGLRLGWSVSSPPPAAYSCCVCSLVAGDEGGGGICGVAWADAPPGELWKCRRGGGGQGRVCGRLAAVGVRCAVKVDSQMRASPSDLDFQPVPVHGKKLNQ